MGTFATPRKYCLLIKRAMWGPLQPPWIIRGHDTGTIPCCNRQRTNSRIIFHLNVQGMPTNSHRYRLARKMVSSEKPLHFQLQNGLKGSFCDLSLANTFASTEFNISPYLSRPGTCLRDSAGSRRPPIAAFAYYALLVLQAGGCNGSSRLLPTH